MNDDPKPEKKHSDLHKALEKLAVEESEKIQLNGPNQTQAGAGAVLANSSLAYYLGSDGGAYFANGFAQGEIPAYVAFVAISTLSLSTLASICGKRNTPSQVAAILNGGAAGLGTAGVVTAVAFGIVVDIALLGSLTLIGGALGWYFTRRGKKKHGPPCGERLHCDTWICPKCKRIIAPSREWTHRDHWNVLDVCDYLETGGLELNTVQAVAFLQWTRLLDKATQIPPYKALWNPKDIKDAATDPKSYREFLRLWSLFATTHDASSPDVERTLREWRVFYSSPNLKPT